jgi:hypothetical protein
MQGVDFSKTANVQFLKSLDDKQVAFSVNCPNENATGKELPFEVMLIVNDELTFRMDMKEAKKLSKQLNNSIGVCECFNTSI